MPRLMKLLRRKNDKNGHRPHRRSRGDDTVRDEQLRGHLSEEVRRYEPDFRELAKH